MQTNKTHDVIVIGAGAAGLFCARTAGLRGRRVLVLDHAVKPGLKILISGGGRCNFTHLATTPADFLSGNPHFCKSALAQFTPDDFLELVQKHKIAWHHKTEGQLFCNHSSKDILRLLLDECDKAKVELLLSTHIEAVSHIDENFVVRTSRGVFCAKSLVVATGGLSFARLGATDLGYKLAQQFGHGLIEQKPALVGFAVAGDFLKLCQTLAGVSLPVGAVVKKHKFIDGMVFTHFGVSGPAILNLSLFWNQGDPVTLEFVTQHDLLQELTLLKNSQPRLHFKNACRKFFPERFVEHWMSFCNIQDQPLADFSLVSLKKTAECFTKFSFVPQATAGFDRAEVTRGGVDVADISSQTLQSKLKTGLFFVGEVMDVTGRLGGFNFQWAWSSGFVAGLHC